MNELRQCEVEKRHVQKDNMQCDALFLKLKISKACFSRHTCQVKLFFKRKGMINKNVPL